MRLSRNLFDVGILTQQRESMLAFWRDELGLPVTQAINPVEGVFQYKLDLKGAVLKLNCVAMALPTNNPVNGLRLLLIADERVDTPRHLKDPDGNRVCLVPPGYMGIHTFGVHFSVSDEAAFAHFYGEVCQLRKIRDRTYDFAGATISFSWSPDVVAHADTTGAGFYYLTFQVMDASEAHAALCRRGAVEVQPVSAGHTTTSSIISFIRDPDGNKIEISQRPDLVAAALRQSPRETP